MFHQLLTANRNFSVDQISEHLVGRRLLIELDVLLIDLHVALFYGLVLTIVDNLIIFTVKGQHDFLRGVSQRGAKR